MKSVVNYENTILSLVYTTKNFCICRTLPPGLILARRRKVLKSSKRANLEFWLRSSWCCYLLSISAPSCSSLHPPSVTVIHPFLFSLSSKETLRPRRRHSLKGSKRMIKKQEESQEARIFSPPLLAFLNLKRQTRIYLKVKMLPGKGEADRPVKCRHTLHLRLPAWSSVCLLKSMYSSGTCTQGCTGLQRVVGNIPSTA